MIHEDTMKISKGTKSRAYTFIKSLMADGASGNDIHNLVTAISDNISDDIGGAILMDLISNRDDSDGDINHDTSWFGPFDAPYFSWIASAFTEYLDERELRGFFRFGDDDEWDEWRKKSSISDEKFTKAKKSAMSQLCVFEFWGDASTNSDTKAHIDGIYDDITKHIKETEDK